MAMSKEQFITPKCCKEVQEKQTVFLSFDQEALIDPEGQEKHKPKWRLRFYNINLQRWSSTEVKYCPHCGSPVPKIKRRDTKRKICSIKDTGYCDTCMYLLYV